MISLSASGDFKKTTKFLDTITRGNYINNFLEECGQEGVAALRDATPKRSGRTASSWSYEIERSSSGCTIHWLNTNINRNVNIAVIIQMGHGTRRGAYVQGIDYINPAIKPVFDKIAEKVWKEVTSA